MRRNCNLLASALTLAALSWGCSKEASTSSAEGTASSAAHLPSSGEPLPAEAAGGGVKTSPTDVSANKQLSGKPCGELGCRTYPSAVEAVRDLLNSEPQMLAFGEAHALKGSEHIRSTTERFEQDILPVLAEAGASSLVVELLKPATGCEQAVKQTRKTEKQVTQKQVTENKNRFVQLGVASRRLGVVPFILEPDCAEFGSIAAAGENGVLRMLELIAIKTEQKMYKLWEQPPPKGKAKLVLAYGGAMHNDILPEKSSAPRAASGDGADPPDEASKAAFTFGRQLHEATKGRYIAVDLIVPEFIKDTPVWKALPWYAHFNPQQPREQATLFQTGPNSFAIIFPHSKEAPLAPGSGSVSKTPAAATGG